jgi:hypothetical protein
MLSNLKRSDKIEVLNSYLGMLNYGNAEKLRERIKKK